MNELNIIWEQCLNMIRPQIPNLSYKTWIQTLKPITRQYDTIYLKSENSTYKHIQESRYRLMLEHAINQTDRTLQKVQIIVDPNDIPKLDLKEPIEIEKAGSDVPVNPEIREYNEQSPLNPMLTFDRFVVGNSNQFAKAASEAVAEKPGEKYNPLFIYGGVGLGKTHLMQSIGNKIMADFPGKRIIYSDCEKFTNSFIYAIQTGKMNEFRERYRKADILLIDDIQFISGKMETQEAFFSTFNSLYELNKQIVLTSDRPPKEIQKLEERLRSRFEMGLIADISLPSYETREAILIKKSQDKGFDIPIEVISYIAQNFHSNIREMEGALISVNANAYLRGKEVTLELAQELLEKTLSSNVQQIDIPYIKKITAYHFDISVEELNSNSRTRKIALPRQVAMYLSREITNLSYPKIGELFGKKDHTTIIHAYKKVENMMKEDPEFAEQVESIKKEILNSQQ